ncbi:helix-turn-helix transcriptional regulator [Fluviicola sp.]|jgi:transcriptional regulator with XRE-family HTH domain|uniref:helix-turn-helix domain-containing protein n=1 Tax=Fluviicola sp. TaxID=1917219 RepID=UPI002822053A|nr:helix-turn-helix transcriptional regulator [Fluviicola sp.]MDR0801588.1 helix-turn-helix domain-containing protein [Fluviicola sp.]
METVKIGENIKKLRELKKITREHMAAELDLSLSGYGKIERDEVDLSISRIYRIAEIIGVDVSQILHFDTSQLFNISNHGNVVQSIGANAKAENMHFHADNYMEKYIKILEAEVERLKAEAGRK